MGRVDSEDGLTHFLSGGVVRECGGSLGQTCNHKYKQLCCIANYEDILLQLVTTVDSNLTQMQDSSPDDREPSMIPLKKVIDLREPKRHLGQKRRADYEARRAESIAKRNPGQNRPAPDTGTATPPSRPKMQMEAGHMFYGDDSRHDKDTIAWMGQKFSRSNHHVKACKYFLCYLLKPISALSSPFFHSLQSLHHCNQLCRVPHHVCPPAP